MAFRSVGRAGVCVGSRVASTSTRTGGMTHKSIFGVGGICERQASSWVGHGHFGHSREPSFGQGSSGASTQLFKLVETDLVSKELCRYESSDAQFLGLHSIQEVLSDLAAAAKVFPERLVTVAAPETARQADESQSDAIAPGVREAGALAAWGQGSRLVGVAPTAEGEGVVGLEGVLEKLAIKRTYQPSTIKRKRMHGFLYRAKSRLGKKILRRRREKGRTRLGI